MSREHSERFCFVEFATIGDFLGFGKESIDSVATVARTAIEPVTAAAAEERGRQAQPDATASELAAWVREATAPGASAPLDAARELEAAARARLAELRAGPASTSPRLEPSAVGTAHQEAVKDARFARNRPQPGAEHQRDRARTYHAKKLIQKGAGFLPGACLQ